MAIMIPEELDEDRKYTTSEEAFFERLRDDVSDEFYIYHTIPYLEGSRARQGEVDFLVLHPHYGMLVIECKGGGISRNQHGKWYRHSSHGREKMSKTPMEQAADQVRDLVTKFSRPVSKMFPFYHGQFPMVRGWALAFPYASWEEVNLPPELERELVITINELDDLEGAIIRAMKLYARRWDNPDKVPRLDAPGQFRQFREGIVSPTVNIAVTLKGKIAMERQRLVRLTEEQSLTVNFIVANKRTRIQGGAGTGKTILAMQAARILAAEGRDVLLTCFNSPLAGYLSTTVEAAGELPGTIRAQHFHRLCYEAGQLLGKPLNIPETPEAMRKYWIEDAPMVLLDALEAKEIGPWDAIIVDEGQDFSAIWWEVLELGLRDRKEGQIAVFYDLAQRIFNHGGAVPDFPTVLPLRQNFRNTKAIAEAVCRLGEVQMVSHPRCKQGEPPSVYEQEGPEKTRRRVAELLGQLLGREGLKPKNIAILTPRSPKNSVLEGANLVGDHRIVHRPEHWEEGVLHMSISKFKGLEADVIIMLDINPENERSGQNARYVAASRARHRLYVFSKGNWLEV